VEAAEKAIHSPLLDDCRIDGAKGILINVTGPHTLTLHEVNEAASFVEEHADDDANIIFGATIDDTMPEDQIEVTVIATGFNGAPIRERGERTAARPEAPRLRSNYRVFSSTRTESVPAEDDGDLEPAPAPVAPRAGAEATLYAAMGIEPDEIEPTRDSEEVYELKDPILEPVETKPQIPVSYRPEEKRAGRGGQIDSDLDIPTFIRRRSSRFPED
jgi:cell division protein FtsZ